MVIEQSSPQKTLTQMTTDETDLNPDLSCNLWLKKFQADWGGDFLRMAGGLEAAGM